VANTLIETPGRLSGSFDHLRQVEIHFARFDTKFISRLNSSEHIRRVQQRFSWDTAPIETGATKFGFLYYRRF
jgi:hypothetical protein